MTSVPLDRAARQFAEATTLPPYLFDLGPTAGRALVDEIQGRPVAKPAVDYRDLVVLGGPAGEAGTRQRAGRFTLGAVGGRGRGGELGRSGDPAIRLGQGSRRLTAEVGC